MNIRKDRKLLKDALKQGIHTAAELAAWLKERTPATYAGMPQA